MNTLSKGFFRRALSALLATIMVFSLGVVGITSISAAEVELADTSYNVTAGMKVYFDNTFEKFDDGHIYFMIGHGSYSRAHEMTRVSNTDLYYAYISQGWGDATQFCVFSTSSTWEADEETSISHRKQYAQDSTNIMNLEGDYSGTFLFTTSETSSALTPAHQPNGYSDLNHTHTVHVYAAEYGSTSYSKTGAGGTVKISGVQLNGDTSTKSESKASTASSSTVSADIMRASVVTMTATPASGYEFVGWSTSTSESGVGTRTSTTLTIDSQTDGTTYYALFKSTTAPLTVNAEASETEIFAGTDIEIIASASDSSATFTLKDSEGTVIEDGNTDGIFIIDTTSFAEGSYTYTVEASATVGGKVVTATSQEITVKVNRFDGLLIYPKAPSSVEAGTNINITVTANTSAEVTYTLTDEDGVEITNTTGIFSITTSPEDKNTTKTFTIGASTVVNDATYTSEAVNIAVKVDPISNTTEVNLYFKATSTKGYVPYATVTGLYESFSEVEMEKAFYIGSNATNSADYWWYKISTKVSDAMPTISFSVVLGRYAFEDEITLTVVDGVTDYYFAIDNLYYDNDKNDMINVTDWNEIERDYCESAVHMVYDPQYDTQTELDTFAQNRLMLANGDVNMDDSVNVKDTTLLQKDLADLAELGTVGEKVADFDCDGVSTIKDATAIQKAVAGL